MWKKIFSRLFKRRSSRKPLYKYVYKKDGGWNLRKEPGMPVAKKSKRRAW